MESVQVVDLLSLGYSAKTPFSKNSKFSSLTELDLNPGSSTVLSFSIDLFLSSYKTRWQLYLPYQNPDSCIPTISPIVRPFAFWHARIYNSNST